MRSLPRRRRPGRPGARGFHIPSSPEPGPPSPAEEAGEIVRKINADGPKNLAIAAKTVDAPLVHISTDYVFGGDLDIEKENVNEISPTYSKLLLNLFVVTVALYLSP